MDILPVGTVEFDCVSKRYRLGAKGTLRGAVAGLFSRKDQENSLMYALRDVSFKAAPGESLGLIGPNGAGKTTTLKLLSKITRPSSGQITVDGRVSSLIELGAGFHPELTGRENIYLNGAILGLRRTEIARKLDDIVDFSGLERFIDTPVKRYSSGMYVRLGFAVAAHVEPDILLVDEVLAVGDASFRHRCIQHMRQLQHSGTTVLFVSHNMHLISSMCDRVLLLMEGQVCAEGPPSVVISEYESLLQAHSSRSVAHRSEELGPVDDSAGSLILTEVEIVPETASGSDGLATDRPATICVYYQARNRQVIGRIAVFIVREEDGVLCSTAESNRSSKFGAKPRELRGPGVVKVTYDPLQLTPGTYYVVVKATDASDSIVLASVQSPVFQVRAGAGTSSMGVYNPILNWTWHQSEDPIDMAGEGE
jgi:lipopolysaccharide transport system ATP-binding protein